jgi:Fe2+ or Zn2+ uptake regulation protein
VRYSHQRETIKNIVYNTNSHPTAEWVFDRTKKIIPNISLGTVYRNLKVLAESDHINIINDGSIARYDWNTDSHGHLKCKVCDNLVDVQLVNDELISKIEKKFEFDVDDVEMTIIGTCSKHT